MPHDFWEYTFGEVMSVFNGYWDRMRVQRGMVEIIYHSCSMVARKPDILDLLPFPGDPSAEDREKMRKEAAKQEQDELKKLFESYYSKGLLN
jgi:hypothetical protein